MNKHTIFVFKQYEHDHPNQKNGDRKINGENINLQGVQALP
jgi:hypothetical protein